MGRATLRRQRRAVTGSYPKSTFKCQIMRAFRIFQAILFFISTEKSYKMIGVNKDARFVWFSLFVSIAIDGYAIFLN